MLTLIAFRLALGSQLPPVAYLTRIDRFVLVATAIVFAALVESVATAALADKDHLGPALKINRWSRIVFPASYLLALYYAFG